MPPSNRQTTKNSSAPIRSTVNAPDPLRKIRNAAQIVVDASDSTLPKKVSTRRLKNALRREKEKQVKDIDMEDAAEVERYITTVPDTQDETVPLDTMAVPSGSGMNSDSFLDAFFGTNKETTSFLNYLRGLDPIPSDASISHSSASISARNLEQPTTPTPAPCHTLPSPYARFVTQDHRRGSSMLRRCDTTLMDGVLYRTPDAQIAKKRRHEDLEEDFKRSDSNSDQDDDGPAPKKSKYDDAGRNTRGQTPGPELEPVDTPAPEDRARGTTPEPEVQHVGNIKEETPEPEAQHEVATPPPTPLIIRPRPKRRTKLAPLRFAVKDWPATVPLPPANIFDDVTPKESGRGWAIVPEATLWMNNVEGMGFDPVNLTLDKIYEPAKKAQYPGHLFVIPGRI